MSITLAIKVNDGVVIAADSAMTVSLRKGNSLIINTYENADKVFHLHKRLPIGINTWGMRNIGAVSISTIIKDFRKSIMNTKMSKFFNERSYSIESVSKLFFEHIDALYKQAYPNPAKLSPLGFMVTGYSSESDFTELWIIQFDESGKSDGAKLLIGPDKPGVFWGGQPEAIERLILGVSPGLNNILRTAEIQPEKIDEIRRLCRERLATDIFFPAMPIQDAIDIASFLIQTTISYTKFVPGPQTVGGPIEIATITKHEGFKWIKRKTYFDPKLNSEG